jgi:hypothetical protein
MLPTCNRADKSHLLDMFDRHIKPIFTLYSNREFNRLVVYFV